MSLRFPEVNNSALGLREPSFRHLVSSLLDEPMSSLDSRLKKRLVPFLLRIRDEFRIPLIYVTHDAGELVALCDEVLMLERGRLIGRGSPADLLV